MPKFFIKTYGCQMNERDSEQVAHSLIARGYERADSEQEADVVLLNTCSVRDMADQKALGKMGMLGRIANERPHVVFGFLGCMAQVRGASLLKNLPHVDLVVGTQKFHRVADYVEELVTKKRGNAERPTSNAQRRTLNEGRGELKLVSVCVLLRCADTREKDFDQFFGFAKNGQHFSLEN